MILSWSINRYIRCYSDSSKQCLDFDQKRSIFQYFAHNDVQKSQALGNIWSVINTCESWKVILTLELNEIRRIVFNVSLIETSNNQSVILVSSIP